MDFEDFLSNLENIFSTSARVGSVLEDWYDEHMDRRQKRRDRDLARYTDEELRFFRQDYKYHPERYEFVSKAAIKAARKRARYGL
jgi:hypothetical protein